LEVKILFKSNLILQSINSLFDPPQNNKIINDKLNLNNLKVQNCDKELTRTH